MTEATWPVQTCRTQLIFQPVGICVLAQYRLKSQAGAGFEFSAQVSVSARALPNKVHTHFPDSISSLTKMKGISPLLFLCVYVYMCVCGGGGVHLRQELSIKA